MDKQKMVVTVLVLAAAVLLLIGSLALMLSGEKTHNYSELPSQSRQDTQSGESIPENTVTGEEKPQPGGVDAPGKDTEPKETENVGSGAVPGGNTDQGGSTGTPIPEGPAIEVETPTTGEMDPDGEEDVPGESTQPSQPTQPEQGGESQEPSQSTEPGQGGEEQDPSQSTEPEETTTPPQNVDDEYDAKLDADELFGGNK